MVMWLVIGVDRWCDRGWGQVRKCPASGESVVVWTSRCQDEGPFITVVQLAIAYTLQVEESVSGRCRPDEIPRNKTILRDENLAYVSKSSACLGCLTQQRHIPFTLHSFSLLLHSRSIGVQRADGPQSSTADLSAPPNFFPPQPTKPCQKSRTTSSPRWSRQWSGCGRCPSRPRPGCPLWLVPWAGCLVRCSLRRWMLLKRGCRAIFIARGWRRPGSRRAGWACGDI
jgi:hypothetical protein